MQQTTHVTGQPREAVSSGIFNYWLNIVRTENKNQKQVVSLTLRLLV